MIARFFRHETCGQCTQCREGTAWLYKLLQRIEAGQGRADDCRAHAREALELAGPLGSAAAEVFALAALGLLRGLRPDRHAPSVTAFG